jgi:hypothetical protein
MEIGPLGAQKSQFLRSGLHGTWRQSTANSRSAARMNWTMSLWYKVLGLVCTVDHC